MCALVALLCKCVRRCSLYIIIFPIPHSCPPPSRNLVNRFALSPNPLSINEPHVPCALCVLLLLQPLLFLFLVCDLLMSFLRQLCYISPSTSPTHTHTRARAGILMHNQFLAHFFACLFVFWLCHPSPLGLDTIFGTLYPSSTLFISLLSLLACSLCFFGNSPTKQNNHKKTRSTIEPKSFSGFGISSHIFCCHEQIRGKCIFNWRSTT